MFFSFSTGASIFLVPGVKCFRFRDARSWPGYFERGGGGAVVFIWGGALGGVGGALLVFAEFWFWGRGWAPGCNSMGI